MTVIRPVLAHVQHIGQDDEQPRSAADSPLIGILCGGALAAGAFLLLRGQRPAAQTAVELLQNVRQEFSTLSIQNGSGGVAMRQTTKPFNALFDRAHASALNELTTARNSDGLQQLTQLRNAFDAPEVPASMGRDLEGLISTIRGLGSNA